MTTYSEIELEYFQKGFQFIAGVDEAGRGPLAGPVVAAAVIFPENICIPGIDDSKKLSPSIRKKLAKEIYLNAVSVGVGMVEPARIDEINILQASIEAMHIAIDRLATPADYLFIDGNQFHHEAIPFSTIVHGDAVCFSIAAASIIAKEIRDRFMIELDVKYPGFGFAQHKGYPTQRHIEALRTYGPTEIHRKSFVVKKLTVPEHDHGFE